MQHILFYHKTYTLFITTLFLLISSSITAQVSWNTSSTGNLRAEVCHQEDTIRVTFSNISGNALDRGAVIVDLPPGISYVVGSLTETSTFNVSYSAVPSSPGRPVFLMDSLPAVGSTVNFTFRIRTNCDAVTHFENGGNFSNTYTYCHGSICEPSHTTPDYNINYPALSFSNVTNANVNVPLGSSYTQQLTITNGGNGSLDSFFIALNPPTGMLFSGVTNGTLNATSDTIFFKGTALGADGLLTAGEDVITSYQIQIISCIDLSTNLTMSWGCDGNFCKTDIFPISASVPSESPIIITDATPSGVRCFDEPDTQRVMITNIGTGLATNMIYEIFSGNANGNTATAPNRTYPIDTASIRVKSGANGTFSKVSPFSTQNGSFGYCASDNRIGRARINLADLPIGDTLFLMWTQTACCPSSSCNSGLAFNAWEYRVEYENECLTENYTTGYIRGSVRGYDNLSFYNSIASGPINIGDNDTSNFIMEYTSSIGLSNPAPDGTLEVNIILPPGISFSGDFRIYNRFLTCSRTADSLVIVSDTVKAFFDFSTLAGCIGGNGAANKAEMHIGLVADCSNPLFDGGPVSIPINSYLVLYPDCSDVCKIPYFCKVWNTDVYCPEPCERGGIQFTSFSAQRSNLGAPDNNNNGIADAAGSLDMNLIRSRTVIAGDTLELRYEAKIDTGMGNTQFEYAYLNMNMLGMAPNGRRLEGIAADIQIFDASTGTIHTCNGTSIIENSTNNFSIDINGCTPAAYVYEKDDSISIIASYRFVTKFNGAVLTHEIQNDFFVSHIPNAVDSIDKFSCNNLGDYFKTIGYYHTTCCGSTFNMESCDSRLASKNYYLSIGPCCSNYANGNYFRNEIRQFSFIDTFEFDLPTGYVMDNTLPSTFSYVYTGGSRGYTNITPIDPNANPVRFILGDFFEPRGGTYPVSDEGYYGTVRMHIRATCNAPESDRIRYNGFYTGIDSTNTFFDDYRATSDLINYTAPEIDVAAVTPVVLSTIDTAIWQFRIDNNANTARAENTFFTLSSAVGSINIEEVRNLTTSTVMTPNANGLYTIGVTAPSSNNLYEIIATQNSCVTDSLLVLVGWDCGGYPVDIASYTCPLDTAVLKVNNPESALQVAVLRDTTASRDSVDMCSPITYEIELTSSQSSVVKDIMASIPSLPTGLNFVASSVRYEYPIGNGFVAGVDPSTVGTALQFDISNYTPELATKGLLGTVDADSTGDRKVKIRFDLETTCDFITGDAFNIQIASNRPCSDPLPTLSYTVAPILIKGTGVTPYATTMTMSADEIVACGDQNAYYYNVSILNLGPGVTAASDSILVRLPTGILFHSYDPSTPSFNNPPAGQPDVATVPGGTNLIWPMQSGVAVGDNIEFSIRIDADDVNNICGLHNVDVLSLISTSIPCLSSGTTCNTSTPSGRGDIDITVSRPSLEVGVDTANSRNFQVGTTDNIVQIVGTIDNTGSNVPFGDTLTVEFFCDDDGSGDYTPGDTYIGMYNTEGGLNSGATHAFTWIDTFPVALCDLNGGENVVALVRAEPTLAPRQCACRYDERYIQDILLPVDFESFTATENADLCQVQLQWQTSAEENLAYFEVQRSTDGLLFETLGQVTAVGSSRTLQTYTWKDKDINTDAYYYRLKIIEFGGGTRYSDYAFIEMPCATYQGQSGILSLYPNPTNKQLNIKFYSHQSMNATTSIRVLDVLGREVLMSNHKILAGMQIIQLDVESLVDGTYTIEFKNKKWSSVRKFIKN